MTRKECFAALGLNEGADLDEIKRAYRKLAFSLHPDLNPDVPDAAKRFRRLNEAYVQLSKTESSGKSRTFFRGTAGESTARAREEAKKAYSKARQGQTTNSSSRQTHNDEGKEDVLKDILNDPFARRVFEDIYSHIREERHRERQNAAGWNEEEQTGDQNGTNGTEEKRNGKAPRLDWTSGEGTAGLKSPYAARPGVINKVRGWLRRQIDDEQVLRLPGESLVPGARVRLQIQHGLGGEPQVIEMTLPPEFVPGKTMRLKGMGKRVGNWRGDLYVRIEPS